MGGKEKSWVHSLVQTTCIISPISLQQGLSHLLVILPIGKKTKTKKHNVQYLPPMGLQTQRNRVHKSVRRPLPHHYQAHRAAFRLTFFCALENAVRTGEEVEVKTAEQDPERPGWVCPEPCILLCLHHRQLFPVVITTHLYPLFHEFCKVEERQIRTYFNMLLSIPLLNGSSSLYSLSGGAGKRDPSPGILSTSNMPTWLIYQLPLILTLKANFHRTEREAWLTQVKETPQSG